MRIWPTKRWWKRIALAFVFLLALALVMNGVMSWRVEHRIQSRLAAIRAAGEPASLADLTPKPVPESENAAAVIAKLGPRLDQFSKDYAKFDDTPIGKGYNARTGIGESPTANQLQAIRAILDMYPDIDAGLAEAASREKYASLTDFSMDIRQFMELNLNEPMGRSRTGSRFLRWRMEELTGAGQRDKAVACGIEALKLARQYDNEPLMINMLVAIAMRGIATEPLYDALNSGSVSPEMHAALDQELARHETSTRLLNAMKTERGFSIDSIKGPPSEFGPPKWLYSFIGWPIKRFQAGAIDYYDVLLDAMSAASKDGPGGRHLAEPDPTPYGPLAALLTPAVQAAFTADVRCTAQLRALRIFNALRQFAEKNGHEATKLEDLGLPAEAVIDPFDGKPLRLKRTEDGWIVYTVMSGGEDDGGDFMEMKDYGVAPPKRRITQKPEGDAQAEPAEPAGQTEDAK